MKSADLIVGKYWHNTRGQWSYFNSTLLYHRIWVTTSSSKHSISSRRDCSIHHAKTI